MRLATAIVVALAVIGTATPPAIAEEGGSIVFGRGKSLWRVPVGDGKPEEIAALGFRARTITALEASRDGRSLLVSAGDRHYFVRADDGGPKPVQLACHGRATLSGDGRCVLCEDKDGKITLAQLHPTPAALELPISGRLVTMLGSRVDRVVAVTERGIESFTVSRKPKRELMAKQKPERDLLVAPDGKRAIAAFVDGGGEEDAKGDPIYSIYQFVLDGNGARRKLVADATAVRWSRDSRWVLAVGPRQTCVARARGGQYRCWRGFKAADLSPDGSEALLIKGSTLHRASLGGARSARPKPLVPRVAGKAAVWVL